MSEIAGYEASLYLMDSDQVPVAFTDEATTANATRTLYKITNRSMKWWDPATPVTVTVTPEQTVAYTVVYAGGAVMFASALSVGSTVTVTGKYFTAVNKVAGAKSWSLDMPVDMIDITSWDTEPGWREYMPSLKSGTVSLERWWLDEFFHTYLSTSARIGLELREDADNIYYVYGYLTGDSIKRATEGAIEESISVQVTGAPLPA